MFDRGIMLMAAACVAGLLCPLRAQTKRIEPVWESIREYPRCPEWLADPDFGIHTHWTPQAVCAKRTNTTGYPAGMYNKRKEAFQYHREHFGDQREFGFKDGRTVYAIFLGWPGDGETATIKAMNENDFSQMIEGVKLIGHYGKIRWQRTPEGLQLHMPSLKPCDYAYCFRVELRQRKTNKEHRGAMGNKRVSNRCLPAAVFVALVVYPLKAQPHYFR